ncbi:MAG: hypothetical protein ACYDBB_03090 [Armatimonadota bacterium]
MAEQSNRYIKLIEFIFKSKYIAGMHEIIFEREDIERTAEVLGIKLPKNLGDLIYSFRFRIGMPESIQATAPEGQTWTIELAGRGKYRLRLKSASQAEIRPNPLMAETKIPDSTPGLVSKYAFK